MSAVSGKKRLSKYSRKSSSFSNPHRTALDKQRVISRISALRKIKNLLAKKKDISSPEVIRLISLFCMHVDELTEAGIPYETIKALEKRHPMLLMD